MDVQIIAAIAFALMSTLGIFLSFLAIAMIVKKKTLHNDFGALCFLHFIACLLNLSIQLFWNAPLAIVEDDNLAVSWLGKRVGQAYAVSWDIQILSQVALALNRFFSITFSARIDALWTHNWTVVAVFVTCLISVLSAIPGVWDDIYFAFTPSQWTYTFPNNSSSQLSVAIGIFVTLGSVLVTIIVNIFSGINLRRIFKASVSNVEWQRINASFVTRRKIETRLFVQTFLQSSLLIATMITGQMVSQMGSSKWYGFASMSTAVVGTCVDALIMLAFHYRTARVFSSSQAKIVVTFQSQRPPSFKSN